MVIEYLKYVIVCALAIGMTSTAALADRGAREGKGAKFFEELDLSPQQREQLRNLRGEREHMHELGTRMRDQRKELGEMLRSDSVTEEDVLRAADALNKTSSELNVARVKNMLEMKRILTPEQRQKAREMLRKKWQERADSGGDDKHGWFWKRKGGGDSCSGKDRSLDDDTSAP